MTREEAIKICKQVRKYFKGGKLATDDTDAIYEALTNAIEALKAQKTGKWIGNEFGECSVCGHKGCASDIWDRCEKHYCPNCGTLLEEEQ